MQRSENEESKPILERSQASDNKAEQEILVSSKYYENFYHFTDMTAHE